MNIMIDNDVDVEVLNCTELDDQVIKDYSDFINSHKLEHYQSIKSYYGVEYLNAIEVYEDIDTSMSIGAYDIPRSGTLKVSIEDVYKVLATAKSFEWANGMAVIPTFYSLFKKGFLDFQYYADSSLESIAKTLIGSSYKKNMGVLWGAINQLGLAGWIVTEGRDEQTLYSLTKRGKFIYDLVKNNMKVIDSLIQTISFTKDLYHHLRDKNLGDKFDEQIEIIKNYFEQDNLLQFDLLDEFEYACLEQFRNYLDGFLLGQILVAMGFPSTEISGVTIKQTSTSVFDKIIDNYNISSLNFTEEYNEKLLDFCLSILIQKNVVHKHLTKLTFTEYGEVWKKKAPAFCGLIGSYFKSYEVLDTILFEDNDPLNIGKDEHVDRVINILASSIAGSRPACITISEEILAHYFNNPDLANQPKGLTDIGCGDGTALKTMVDYVLEHTYRGRCINEYPLWVIGADLNEASLMVARENLSEYSENPNINVRVIQADISRPDLYDLKLQDEGIQLKDLIPSFMFLIHNRKLTVENEAKALEIFGDAMSKCDLRELDEIMLSYFNVKCSDIIDDPLQIIKFFKTSFSNNAGMVKSFVVAADLIDFFNRWKPYSRYGFIGLESHTPWNNVMCEDEVMRNHKFKSSILPQPFNWGMHYPSQQYLVPYNEYRLALCLSGFKPLKNKVHGSILGKGIPNIDDDDTHRFFSIGCYVPNNKHLDRT